jgi:hypothetical protein
MFQPCIFPKLNRYLIFNDQKAMVLWNCFCWTTSFLKKSFVYTQKFQHCRVKHIRFFFVGFLSNTTFIRLLISFSIFFASKTWYAFTCFSSIIIIPFLFIIWYYSFPFFCSRIKNYKTNVTIYIMHNLKFPFINYVIVI